MSHRQLAIKRNLQLRAGVMASLRAFFTAHGYLEVDTPCRIRAQAPEAYVDAQPSGRWFLQTSPELCMKRLLAAGYARIFQICKCFRQHERGGKHLPELTMLEWYTAGDSYLDMMRQCETLLQFVIDDRRDPHVPRGSVTYRGTTVDFTSPWPKLRVAEAFERFSPVSMETALETDRFDEIMVTHIEPGLGHNKPLFLYDYPAVHGALARLKPGNPMIAERFELYIHGLELCNGFSELTDPHEQRLRFEDQNRIRNQNGLPPYPMPEKFLAALAHMPESAGNALGVDRLIMLLADLDTIDAGVAFTPEEL